MLPCCSWIRSPTARSATRCSTPCAARHRDRDRDALAALTKWWVYENNSMGGDHLLAIGDFRWFFAAGSEHEWGGKWAFGARSQNHLESDVQAGDIMVCYQTDLRTIVGVAEVSKLTYGDDARLWLRPVNALDPGIKIHEPKRQGGRYAPLAKMEAWRQGVISSLYPLDADEAHFMQQVLRMPGPGRSLAATAGGAGPGRCPRRCGPDHHRSWGAGSGRDPAGRPALPGSRRQTHRKPGRLDPPGDPGCRRTRSVDGPLRTSCCDAETRKPTDCPRRRSRPVP